MNVTDCCRRLLRSRSGSPRWSTTRMMLTLRTKWTRWAAPLTLPDNNGPVVSTTWQIRVELKRAEMSPGLQVLCCVVHVGYGLSQSCCWLWETWGKKRFFWHCVCSFPQLMEVTGKNQDECMVALHDCNEDVSRAINFLLECTSDMVNNVIWLVSHLTVGTFTRTLIFHWYLLFSHVNRIF